jgi:hypothetical protein
MHHPPNATLLKASDYQDKELGSNSFTKEY